MYLTAGNFSCRRGQISLPLTGAWIADVVIDPDSSNATPPGQGSSLALGIGEGGFTLQGTVARINLAFGNYLARLVGGGWGLHTVLTAKAYQNVTFGLVLSDVLSQCSEQLSMTTPTNVTNIFLPFWTVQNAPGWKAIQTLILGARNITGTLVNWRVLPDGTIFVGAETWPATPLSSFDLLSWSPQELRATFYSQNPNLIPGQVWQQGNVTQVEHVIEPDKIRTTAWWQVPT
jgi:hypothetical protein